MVAAYENSAPINISDFASSIEYSKLETSEETFYQFLALSATLGDSMILMKASDRISLFDRSTGAYVKDIGHKGDDPEGFLGPLNSLGVNTRNNTVYAQAKQFGLHEYSLSNGKLVNTIPGPDVEGMNATISAGSAMNVSLMTAQGVLKDSLVAGYFLNIKGDEPVKMIVYNRNGEVLKVYPNHQSYEKLKNMIRIESVDFHNYDDGLFFKENYNDTVFSVSADTLQPAIFYNLGEFSPPYEKQESMSGEERSKYMFVRKTVQSEDYVFYYVGLEGKGIHGYFDRKTKQSRLAEAKSSETILGFNNDIDDFFPFYPKLVNDQNELVGLVKAEEVYEWFQNNPDKIAALPKKLQSLQNIDPEDNPIIMFAKLK